MKISFLSSSSGWGGLEQNLLRYARWMNEVGHDVELNCVAETALAREAANQGQRIRFIARQPRHYPLRAARVLRRHLQQNSTEVLWVRDPRDLSLCSGAVRGIKTRLLFHQGMQIPKPKKAPWHALRFNPNRCLGCTARTLAKTSSSKHEHSLPPRACHPPRPRRSLV